MRPLPRLLPSFSESSTSRKPNDPPLPLPESPSSDSGGKPKRKRSLTAVACQACHQSKVKCDGQRPACGRCVVRNRECKFDAEKEDKSRSSALKRRYEALEKETASLRELFELLRTRPESEAFAILTTLRRDEDPAAVLEGVRQGKITGAPMNPAPAPYTTVSQPSVSQDDNHNKRLKALDLDALLASPIKVRAHPWTTLVGDGLLSKMISGFFSWDQTFFIPSVDRKLFLLDMDQQNPAKATHCSPLLINSICALRSFTCERAKSFGLLTGQDMVESFLAEAKILLDKQWGRTSLANVQSLCMLYLVCTCLGRDRAGIAYRHAAADMMKDLRLEARFAKLDAEIVAETEEKGAISRALWGIFCFESRLSFNYLQPSLVPPPQVPRLFDILDTAFSGDDGNLDILGHEFSESSHQPPLVPHVFNAICDSSCFLYESMTYNEQSKQDVGSEKDLQNRMGFYNNLMEWENQLPDKLKHDKNFTPQTCHLRMFFSEVIISILRPLHHDTHMNLPSQSTTALVGDVCLQRCIADVEAVEAYKQTWPLDDAMILLVRASYSTLLTLVSLLHDPRSHGIFTRMCAFIHTSSTSFKLVRLIFSGLKAMAWSLQHQIPHDARKYLQLPQSIEENWTDVPMKFVLPRGKDIRQAWEGYETDETFMTAELGEIISRWHELSIED